MNKQFQPIDPILLESYREAAKLLGPGPLQELIDHIDYLEHELEITRKHDNLQNLLLRKVREGHATTETNC